MKYLFSFLFLLPLLASGQSQPTPFKKANTIVIQTNDSTGVIIKNLIGALAKNGFSVAFADKETGIVNTGAKVVKCDETTLNAIIDSRNIILTGTFKTNYITSTMPVCFRGMKDSSFMNTWLLMQKVANSYPNATLQYEKR